MNNVIISLISLAMISACEVNVNNDVKVDAEPAPFARVVEPEVLPTTDPLEAFLMPASFNPAVNTISTKRSVSDDLSIIKLYIRESGTVSPYSNRDWTIYNAFIESADGSQIERANVMVGVGNGWSRIMVCTNYQADDIAKPCSMVIRGMMWINSNTASYELCHIGTVGAENGVITETSCVTKYSNE